MRYVRFATGFILSPEGLPAPGIPSHRHLAVAAHGTVISAGFAHFHADGSVSCRGRSESLNKDSLPEDSNALADFLGIKERSKQ